MNEVEMWDGHRLYWEEDNGSRRYYSSENSRMDLVWDTALIGIYTIEAALKVENKRIDKEVDAIWEEDRKKL